MSDDLNPYRTRPSAFPWPPVLWFGAMALAWLAGRAWPLGWPGLDDAPARAFGWGVGLAGIALLLWSILALWRAGTTVLPDRGADVLVTTGPFRRFRNPIYLAHVMIVLGLAELTKNVWFVIFAFVYAGLVTLAAIVPEERHLEARFGAAYLDYKARSRRWL